MQQKIQNKSRDGHGSRCKHHLEKWTGTNENVQKTEGNRLDRQVRVGVKTKKDQRDSERSSGMGGGGGVVIVWPYLELFPNPPPTDSSIMSFASLFLSPLHAVLQTNNTNTASALLVCKCVWVKTKSKHDLGDDRRTIHQLPFKKKKKRKKMEAQVCKSKQWLSFRWRKRERCRIWEISGLVFSFPPAHILLGDAHGKHLKRESYERAPGCPTVVRTCVNTNGGSTEPEGAEAEHTEEGESGCRARRLRLCRARKEERAQLCRQQLEKKLSLNIMSDY